MAECMFRCFHIFQRTFSKRVGFVPGCKWRMLALSGEPVLVARIAESDVFEACRFLFGNDIQLSLDFLSYLQPNGAKSAYRRKVKETHPDLYGQDDTGKQQSQTEKFQKLLSSYEVVCDFFKLRESGLWTPSAPPSAPVGPTNSTGVHPAPPRQPFTGATRSVYLPRRGLQIGLFLYYRKCIDYRLLMDALFWQRRQRPNLGDIAQRWGWLQAPDVDHILSLRGGGRRFGEKAVGLDFITQRQLQTLLFYQRSQQKKLGQFFVENAVLGHDEMEKLVKEQKEHNRCYGSGSMFSW